MIELADVKRKTPRLSLDTPLNARKALGRLIRLRYQGKIESEMFRDIVYGFSSLINYDKLLADLRIEERLTAIENRTAAREASR
ncbi:MAG: hypothetical protein M0001_03625 [Treponema sp.]|nr:hypothetical protein [Treponema sp.]